MKLWHGPICKFCWPAMSLVFTKVLSITFKRVQRCQVLGRTGPNVLGRVNRCDTGTVLNVM